MTEATRQRLLSFPLLLVVLAMTFWSFWHGSELIRADMHATAARLKVYQWAQAQKGWTADEWQHVRAELLAALEIAPTDPVLHDAIAQLYVTQGSIAWSDPEQREAFFTAALEHQRLSLSLRPNDGPAWVNLAVSLFALGGPSPEFLQAWHQARRFAPQEAAVQRTLFDLALAAWDSRTPEMQDWVAATWKAASPGTRSILRDGAKRRGRADLLS